MSRYDAIRLDLIAKYDDDREDDKEPEEDDHPMAKVVFYHDGKFVVLNTAEAMKSPPNDFTEKQLMRLKHYHEGLTLFPDFKMSDRTELATAYFENGEREDEARYFIDLENMKTFFATGDELFSRRDEAEDYLLSTGQQRCLRRCSVTPKKNDAGEIIMEAYAITSRDDDYRHDLLVHVAGLGYYNCRGGMRGMQVDSVELVKFFCSPIEAVNYIVSLH